MIVFCLITFKLIAKGQDIEPDVERVDPKRGCGNGRGFGRGGNGFFRRFFGRGRGNDNDRGIGFGNRDNGEKEVEII